METISIEATPHHFRMTLEQTLHQLRTLLYSGRVPIPTDDMSADDIGLELARICGRLSWCCEAVILDPASYAETRFRAAPPPIPSEREDYSDLLDIWAICDLGEDEDSGCSIGAV